MNLTIGYYLSTESIQSIYITRQYIIAAGTKGKYSRKI